MNAAAGHLSKITQDDMERVEVATGIRFARDESGLIPRPWLEWTEGGPKLVLPPYSKVSSDGSCQG